jgi:hypothetical protein
MAKHTYVSSRNSGLSFTAIYKDAETEQDVRYRVKFENGQFQTDNDLIAEAIDKLIASVMNIRSRCKKADKAAAEKLVAEHQKQMATTGAHKGGITASAMHTAMHTELQTRDEELSKTGVDKVALANEESLVLTEEGATQPSAELATVASKPALKIG